jgi:hypothetical protein
MSNLFKVYIIKCKSTGEIYTGRTESTNPKYNPIRVLYDRHKKDSTKYVALGKCIKEHGFTDFVFTVVKELPDIESLELINKIKEKYADKSLNDENKSQVDYFSEEMELLKNW